MIINYEFRTKLSDFGVFLNAIAKKSKLNYKLYYEDDLFNLVLDESRENIIKFSEDFKKIPYFLFLEDYEISYENSKMSKEFISCILQNPLNLCDDEFSSLGSEKPYKIVKNSDFCLVANYELLKKAFKCDKNTQILLNAYEKPFIKLELKSLYKNAHNLKDFLYVAIPAAKTQFDSLKNNDELVFIEIENPLIIKPFANDFYVVNNPYTTKLCECFNIDNLSFNLPKNKSELIKLIKSLENGEKLLNNYEKRFSINDFSLNEDGILALIKLVDILLESDILNNLPRHYQKGLRIDFDFCNKEHFAAKIISSIFSYRLANAKMIEIGFFESLVAMLGKMNTENRIIYTKLINNDGFLEYNAFLNPHLKLSKWENYERNY